jgi:hypothetical protein
MFAELDKETALNVYIFLSKYRSILDLYDTTLEDIERIVHKKFENVLIYRLNPTLTDLMKHNFYKLYVDNELFLVPLWHSVSYFDGPDCEIIVTCVPDTSKQCKVMNAHHTASNLYDALIDENNNLLVELYMGSECLDLHTFISSGFIDLNIGGESFSIPTNELYMSRLQYYYFKKQGLVNIKKDDICDLSDKSDIIVKISF